MEIIVNLVVHLVVKSTEYEWSVALFVFTLVFTVTQEDTREALEKNRFVWPNNLSTFFCTWPKTGRIEKSEELKNTKFAI